MLGKHLLPESELSALVQAVTSNFDVRKLRAGNIYQIERLFDGRIRSFEYEIDPTRALRASRRDGDIALFDAEVVELPRTTTRVVVEGTHRPRRARRSASRSSSAGERLDLALALADIFGGEIDFNSGLQPGDAFRARGREVGARRRRVRRLRPRAGGRVRQRRPHPHGDALHARRRQGRLLRHRRAARSSASS